MSGRTADADERNDATPSVNTPAWLIRPRSRTNRTAWSDAALALCHDIVGHRRFHDGAHGVVLTWRSHPRSSCDDQKASTPASARRYRAASMRSRTSRVVRSASPTASHQRQSALTLPTRCSEEEPAQLTGNLVQFLSRTRAWMQRLNCREVVMPAHKACTAGRPDVPSPGTLRHACQRGPRCGARSSEATILAKHRPYCRYAPVVGTGATARSRGYRLMPIVTATRTR